MSIVKTGLVKVNDRVDTVATDVSGLASTVTTVQGDVSTLSGSVSTLSGSVSTLSGQVTSLDGQVSTLSSSVSTLSGTVSSQGASIQTLNIAVNGQTTDINNLKTAQNSCKFKVVTNFDATDLYSTKDYNGGLLVWDDANNYQTSELNLFAAGFQSSSVGGFSISEKVRVANANQGNKLLTVRLTNKISGYTDLVVNHGGEAVCFVHDNNTDQWKMLSGGSF